MTLKVTVRWTEAKRPDGKIRLFSKEIDGKTPLPSNRAWSRASKKVGPLPSIDQGPEKSESEGAKKGPFCMGILATLGLSTEFAPRAEKNIFVGKVASEHP